MRACTHHQTAMSRPDVDPCSGRHDPWLLLVPRHDGNDSSVLGLIAVWTADNGGRCGSRCCCNNVILTNLSGSLRP